MNRIQLKDGWEIEREVEDGRGNITSRYWYKGKLAIRHELKTPHTQKLTGYTLIDKDLDRLIDWLEEIHSLLGKFKVNPNRKHQLLKGDERAKITISALLVAIITTYGKLFTTAGGRKYKLEKSSALKGSRFLALHDELMVWRHNYTAHSGAQRREHSTVILTMCHDGHGELKTRLDCETTQPSSFSADEYLQIIELCRELKSYCDGKLKESLETIRTHDLSNESLSGIVALYQKAGRRL